MRIVVRQYPLAVCLLLVLGAATAFPRTAHASCGDYLRHRLHRTFADQAFSIDEWTIVVALDDVPAPPPTAPCRGPLCRSSQPKPAPGPVPERISHDQQAIVAGCAEQADETPFKTTSDDIALVAQAVTGGIFHPPRS